MNRPEKNKQLVDYNLHKLFNTIEINIHSTFKFIKEQLIILKRQFHIESTQNGTSFMIESNTLEINTIKQTIERLIHLDKQLQMKLGIGHFCN